MEDVESGKSIVLLELAAYLPELQPEEPFYDDRMREFGFDERHILIRGPVRRRFKPGKVWPHPVLRPPVYGDDYPRAEFEVDIAMARIKGSTAVELDASFELSDPDLLRLVKEGGALYALLIKATDTHFRKLITTAGGRIQEEFSSGNLSGRVELASFLISVQELPGFRAAGWHSDFSGRTFDIPAGAVLAEDVPKDYWVDTADEAPLGSILGSKPSSNLPDGRWRYALDGDRVFIVMSEGDYAKYTAARDSVNNQPEGQYLMNGLYLPALMEVLHEVDQDSQEYEDRRWYASLDQRLESVGCKPLGSQNANRLIDAQRVLELPFAKMPMIAQAEAENA